MLGSLAALEATELNLMSVHPYCQEEPKGLTVAEKQGISQLGFFAPNPKPSIRACSVDIWITATYFSQHHHYTVEKEGCRERGRTREEGVRERERDGVIEGEREG